MDLIPVFDCILYLCAVSILSFFAGRLLPKSWFDHRRFPYRSFCFEKNGKLYLKLKINRWQNKLPDMSRLFPKLMPAKKLNERTKEGVTVMIRETCIAEMIHSLLALCGLYCIKLCSGPGGLVISCLYALGNLPFVLIQRYNRPRLVRLLARMEVRKATENET